MSEAAYRHSNFFEQLVEHVFISEVLQEAWYGLGKIVEVLRSEVDGSGFDVVLECDGVLRHVQLKTSLPSGATASQKVNVALALKPSGCVVWLLRHEDLKLGRIQLSYRFFGNEPGKPLPSLERFKVAKHTKGDSTGLKRERPNIRVIPKREFVAVPTVRELAQRLFGLNPTAAGTCASTAPAGSSVAVACRRKLSPQPRAFDQHRDGR